MKKIEFKDDEEPAIDEKTLNELQDNIEEEINLKSIFVDDALKETEVLEYESETSFALPDNYSAETSVITVMINNTEITEYFIQELPTANFVVLNNAVSNCLVKVRCQNVSNGFIKLLENRMSVG